MTKKSPENYSSELIDSFLNEISLYQQKKTRRKMMLAARIADALKERGLKKKDLASLMNKHPSEITKWLSGTHNFTAETLWEIGDALGINLININEENEEQIIYIGGMNTSQIVDTEINFNSMHEYTRYLTKVKSQQTIHHNYEKNKK